MQHSGFGRQAGVLSEITNRIIRGLPAHSASATGSRRKPNYPADLFGAEDLSEKSKSRSDSWNDGVSELQRSQSTSILKEGRRNSGDSRSNVRSAWSCPSLPPLHGGRNSTPNLHSAGTSRSQPNSPAPVLKEGRRKSGDSQSDLWSPEIFEQQCSKSKFPSPVPSEYTEKERKKEVQLVSILKEGRRNSRDMNSDSPQSAGVPWAADDFSTGRPGFLAVSANDKDAPDQIAKDAGEVNASAEGCSLMKRRMKKPLAAVQTKRTQSKLVFKVLAPDEKISDFFDTNEQIYEGGKKGKVMRAKRKGMTGDEADCVLKIRYKKADKEAERIWRNVMEELIMSKSGPHVLDLHEILEDEQAFYIIMPNCNGGELFEFLANETEVPEKECKRIIKEILFALQDVHSKGLIHRDVKPENIMFCNEECSSSGGSGNKRGKVKLLNGEATPQTSKTVKLIDFDTCRPWTPKTPKIARVAGTPGYIAPEALLGQPAPQTDLYAVGVILFILMTGDMPWIGPLPSLKDTLVNSPSTREYYNYLKEEKMDWTCPEWRQFPEARDLCEKLLKFEVSERISTAEEAMKHPWLRQN